jgi:hypothetical protein
MREQVGRYRVAMRMDKRFPAVPREVALVSVMGVVDMGVRRVQRLMGVIMLMPLADAWSGFSLNTSQAMTAMEGLGLECAAQPAARPSPGPR